VRTATHRVPQPHLRVLFSNDHGPPTPHRADPGAPSGAGHAGQVRAPPGPADRTAARISHHMLTRFAPLCAWRHVDRRR
jgi:hypothetical protein